MFELILFIVLRHIVSLYKGRNSICNSQIKPGHFHGVETVMGREVEENNITKKSVMKITPFKAEAGGFEPPVRLPVRQFSKLVVSATHPNFLPSLRRGSWRIRTAVHGFADR